MPFRSRTPKWERKLKINHGSSFLAQVSKGVSFLSSCPVFLFIFHSLVFAVTSQWNWSNRSLVYRETDKLRCLVQENKFVLIRNKSLISRKILTTNQKYRIWALTRWVHSSFWPIEKVITIAQQIARFLLQHLYWEEASRRFPGAEPKKKKKKPQDKIYTTREMIFKMISRWISRFWALGYIAHIFLFALMGRSN